MVTPTSEVYWRVDNGPLTLSLVLDTVSVAIPPNNTGLPYHRYHRHARKIHYRSSYWFI